MSINFTKAIELQTVRKLKSHAKVGYQDHPRGDKYCSNCTMFVAGNPPACTHVAPPIAAQGYCDDHEPVDPNQRAKDLLAGISRDAIVPVDNKSLIDANAPKMVAKSFAEVLKDGPADEARDNQGKWTTGSGAGHGTTRQSGRTGGRIAGRRGQSVSTYLDAELRREERQQTRDDKQMKDAQQKVDDLQRQLHEHSQDKSEDLYWGVHRMYQQAVIDLHELHQRVFGKVFNPDEPRDEKGRWTAGDSPSHPDWMHGEEGSHLASAMEDVPKGINESADHIEEARQALEDSSATASDHSEEEPDSGTKEYAAWEKQNNVNLNDVADKTMALHQAIVDHMDATAGVLSQLRGRIAIHASENGIRMGKSMTVGDVHATTALGNQPPNKRKAKDFLTTIVEVKGARVVAMPAMDFGKALRMIKAGPEDEPRDEHGRWTDGGDKNMPPNRVQPPHQVTDSAHFNDLVSSMKENGWQGRPILAIDLGNGIEALTGSHRIAAAQEADLDKIPVKFIEPGVLDYEDNDGYTFRDRQTMGDEELAAFLREAGDRKSAALMDEEVRTQKIGINRNSAMDFDKALSFIKAGPADEARDYHGRWTADGDDPTTPPFPQSQYGSDRVISTIQNKISRGVEPVLTWKFDTKGQPIPIPIEWGKNRIAPNFIAYWSLEKRTVNVLFMRHGPTRFNNQTDMSKDRVRSWNNVPLTAEGIEDAEKAGEKLKDEGIGYIVSSDLGRAIQTSKLVGKAVGIKPIHDYGMRPWNLGKFTGMSTDEAHDGIMHHVENPDDVVDGGESFNTFKARAAQAMLSHIKKAGGKKMLVVSHHRNERLFAAMRPDGTVDAKKFMKSGEDPGDFTEMEFSTDELQNAFRSAKEGHGEGKVGKVWGSNAELPEGVRGALPQEAQTVWRRVANGRIKAGQSEESAIRQAWTAVKNGWSKTKDGWVRKTWLEPDGVHEFVEAELAKLGGSESSIAKPTDNVNVSLQLIPLDDQNARSPFPYDQYFFSDLRNDQKERMLAALTDQDALEEREIPLSMLSAVQDRVDPGKIQSMIEGAPEKRPVVVRIGPGRHCIIDGHHRLTAAKLSGVKTVKVKYLNIEGYDPRVHTDDNPGAKGEPVNKSDDDGWEQQFVISKVDEEQMKVYGWASVTQVGDEIILDKQDDIIPDDELEKAAHDYVLYHRQQGDMHERMGVGRICESALYNQERWDLGLRAHDDETGLKKFGWFVVFKVDDPGVWARIKAGDLPEFSIGGKARREEIDV